MKTRPRVMPADLATRIELQREEMRKWRDLEARGVIVGIHVQPPSPWEPATEMARLAGAGHSVDEIAATLGYSRMTVERHLRAGGSDRRVSPECSAIAARLYKVDEAIRESPLPCGPECVCWWRPIFRTEVSW